MCSGDKACIWTLTHKPIDRLPSIRMLCTFNHPDIVRKATFLYPKDSSVGNEVLVTACSDGRFYVWDVQNQCSVYSHQARPVDTPIFRCTVQSDNERLITCGKDTTFRIFNIQTREAICILRGHIDAVEDVDISSDGKILASCSKDRRVCLWYNLFPPVLADSGGGRHKCRKLLGHRHWVFSVKFSPDGELLASCSANKSALLWSLRKRRLLHFFTGHTNNVGQLLPKLFWVEGSGHQRWIRNWC